MNSEIPTGFREQSFRGQLRASLVTQNGVTVYKVSGYAATFNTRYQMYSAAGPYWEILSPTALDKSLAADPDVSFIPNHVGVNMARTTNGSLVLSADAVGLKTTAYLNPLRQDVIDLVSAIDDRDLTEMSFSFQLISGSWSDDLQTFTITEADINRSNLGPANYGANPYTSVGAGPGSDEFDALILGRAAPVEPAVPVGGSLASWRSQLDLGNPSGPGVGYEGTLGMWRAAEVRAADDYAALASHIRSGGRTASTAEGYELESLRLQVELAQIRQREILKFSETL